MELSLLCGVDVFLLVADDSLRRVVHYTSTDTFDPLDVFNGLHQREFFTNDDYSKVGGKNDDDDKTSIDQPERRTIFSMKRLDRLASSQFGNLAK